MTVESIVSTPGESRTEPKAGKIVGFCITDTPSISVRERAEWSLDAILQNFPWLMRLDLDVGRTHLLLWGHGDLRSCLHRTPDGALWIVNGVRESPAMWRPVVDALARTSNPADMGLPFDGRANLLQVDADGRGWTLWNDWCGSIPVFHTEVSGGRIASTLEPVVVSAGEFTTADFFMPGLVSLLINGHYLGDWTLFEGMKVVRPDSVSVWKDGHFRSTRLWAVRPSDVRWDRGWSDLAEEMHCLFHEAIAGSLRTEPAWILPLSGGIDSRLIAAVGAEIGTELHTFTYGQASWVETVHARSVARALGLPWKRVPIPTDYLVRYTRLWLEWFGSALHCHGMYQMPFLEAVRDLDLPIVTGFTGDPLAGAQTEAMMEGSSADSMLDRLLRKWQFWSVADAAELLIDRDAFHTALDAIHCELESQTANISGSLFQQTWLIFQWNHVFGFSYYQPMMYDYWKGVGTPYLSRSLAEFCLSLPRTALEGRRLQKEAIRRFHPNVATIAGTFGAPVQLNKPYLARRAIATLLPPVLRRGPLREFATSGNIMQVEALRAYGRASLWPLDEVGAALGDLFDTSMLEETVALAASGDETAYNLLRPIQAVAQYFTAERMGSAPVGTAGCDNHDGSPASA